MKEHAGLDILIGKLNLEALHGEQPLLPDPRYGQDVAMLAFVIDVLRKERNDLRALVDAVGEDVCKTALHMNRLHGITK